MSTPIQQIRELRALYDEGLLSAHEFAQRKNGILDSVFQLSASKHNESYAEAGERQNQKRNSKEQAPNTITTDLGYLTGQHLLGNGKEYRLQKQIGQGGMGQVWQVHDLSTEAELGYSEPLALKILSPEQSQRPLHRRLLIEEARLVRKLAHENIVRVYDWGQDPATGSVFIVMEYLEGQDIEQYLRDQLARATPEHRGLSLQHALKILRPVANALHYAWKKQGLVHRDLKPSNIFLCKSGHIKLLDFGIATRLPNAMIAAPHAGTSGYRAPEIEGNQKSMNPTSDVYAMAVMLYLMLQSRLPFADGRTRTQSLRYPSTLNAHQWKELQRALSWNAADRHADSLAFIHALESTHEAQATHPLHNRELQLRDQARIQRKQLEQQRRQQASLTLNYLRELAVAEQSKPSPSSPIAETDTSNWSSARGYLKRMSREIN